MLSPECDPRIPRNAITEVRRVHLEDTVSALIQCAVMPRNEAFVWSAVQRSMVVDTRPLDGA